MHCELYFMSEVQSEEDLVQRALGIGYGVDSQRGV